MTSNQQQYFAAAAICLVQILLFAIVVYFAYNFNLWRLSTQPTASLEPIYLVPGQGPYVKFSNGDEISLSTVSWRDPDAR